MSQSLLHIIRTVYQCSFVKRLSGRLKGPGQMTLPTGGKVNRVLLVVFAANSVGRKIHLGDSRVALANRESRSPIGHGEGVSCTEVGEQGGVEDEGAIDEEIGDDDW